MIDGSKPWWLRAAKTTKQDNQTFCASWREDMAQPMNLIKVLDGTSSLQVAQRTEKQVKLHHRDAIKKVQTGKFHGPNKLVS